MGTKLIAIILIPCFLFLTISSESTRKTRTRGPDHVLSERIDQFGAEMQEKNYSFSDLLHIYARMPQTYSMIGGITALLTSIITGYFTIKYKNPVMLYSPAISFLLATIVMIPSVYSLIDKMIMTDEELMDFNRMSGMGMVNKLIRFLSFFGGSVLIYLGEAVIIGIVVGIIFLFYIILAIIFAIMSSGPYEDIPLN